MSGTVTIKELRTLALTGDSPLIMTGDGDDKKIGVSFGGHFFSIFQPKEDYNLVRRAVFEALKDYYGEDVATFAFMNGAGAQDFIQAFTSTTPLTGRDIRRMFSEAEMLARHPFLKPSDFENLAVTENLALQWTPGHQGSLGYLQAVELQYARTDSQTGLAVRQLVLNSLIANYGRPIALEAYRAGDGDHLGEDGQINVNDDDPPLTTDQIRKMLEVVNREDREVLLDFDVSMHQVVIIDWMRRIDTGQDLFTEDKNTWLKSCKELVNITPQNGVYRLRDGMVVVVAQLEGAGWVLNGDRLLPGKMVAAMFECRPPQCLWQIDLLGQNDPGDTTQDPLMSIGIHLDRSTKQWRIICPGQGMWKVPNWLMIKSLRALLEENCEGVQSIRLMPLKIDQTLLGLFEPRGQHWVCNRHLDLPVLTFSDRDTMAIQFRTNVSTLLNTPFEIRFSEGLRTGRCIVTVDGGTLDGTRMLTDQNMRTVLLDLVKSGNEEEDQKNEQRDMIVVDRLVPFLNTQIARITTACGLPLLMTEELLIGEYSPTSQDAPETEPQHWMPMSIDPDEKIRIKLCRNGTTIEVVYYQRLRFDTLQETDGRRRSFDLEPGTNKVQSKCGVTIDIQHLQSGVGNWEPGYTISEMPRIDLNLECLNRPGMIVVVDPRTAFDFEETDGRLRATLSRSLVPYESDLNHDEVSQFRTSFRRGIRAGMSIETEGVVNFISHTKYTVSDDMLRMWGVLLSPRAILSTYSHWMRDLTGHGVTGIRIEDFANCRIKIRERLEDGPQYDVEIRFPLWGFPNDRVVFDYWDEPRDQANFYMVMRFGASEGVRTHVTGWQRYVHTTHDPEIRLMTTDTGYIERVERPGNRIRFSFNVNGRLRAILHQQLGEQFAKCLVSLDDRRLDCRTQYDRARLHGMVVTPQGEVDISDNDRWGVILSPLVFFDTYRSWVKDLTGHDVRAFENDDFQECSVTVSNSPQEGAYDIEFRYPLLDFPRDYLDEPEGQIELYLVVTIRAWQEGTEWKCEPTGNDRIDAMGRWDDEEK